MNWTTPEEVVTLWTGAEPPQLPNPTLNALIEYAEAVVLDEFPDMPTYIAQGQKSVIIVRGVIASMVMRAFNKVQDGRSSYSETIGSFSQSGSYGTATATDFVELTDSERARLTPRDKIQKVASVRLPAMGEYFEAPANGAL